MQQGWRLGSYELQRRLGEGGMAQVHLARDVRLGREVAIKVLDGHLAERPGFRERFLREARVVASLDHPNIVPLFDFGEENGMLYLVMPFLSGGSLQDMLRKAPLHMGVVASYGSQIADALEYAHQRNVVHRDVKPANVLIHADGRVMLSDFGLAKILDASGRPAAPRNHPDAGTPEYMAPEQIQGRTDERSDIYALGVVLYLLLTGRLPFTGSTSNSVMEAHLYRLPEPLRRSNPVVAPAMEAVVLRALAKNPEERFQRASELGAALLSALIAGDSQPGTFEGVISGLPTSLPPIHTPLPSLDGPPPSMARGVSRASNTGRPGDFSVSLFPNLDAAQPGADASRPQPAASRFPESVPHSLGGSSPGRPLFATGAPAGRSQAGPRSMGYGPHVTAAPQSSSFAPFAPAVSQVPFTNPPDGIPAFPPGFVSPGELTAPAARPALTGTAAPAQTPAPAWQGASVPHPGAGRRPQRLWIVLVVLLVLLLLAVLGLLRWVQLNPGGVL